MFKNQNETPPNGVSKKEYLKDNQKDKNDQNGKEQSESLIGTFDNESTQSSQNNMSTGKIQRRQASDNNEKLIKMQKQICQNQVPSWINQSEDQSVLQQNQMYFRFGACLAAIFYFNWSRTFSFESQINPKECMRDYTFIWTEKANTFLVKNVAFREWYMIYAGFLMDCMQIFAVQLWYREITTFRTMLNFGLFNVTRQFIQDKFLMARLEGFAWFDPHVIALTIPYHDSNDFYWSGHIGTCFMYSAEFYFAGYYKMFYTGIFIGINQWILLWLVRTHYIIDFITALIIAHWAIINAEWISYFLDVKVCGWAKELRNQHWHQPCEKCGWSNEDFTKRICKEERVFLEKTRRIKENNKRSNDQIQKC